MEASSETLPRHLREITSKDFIAEQRNIVDTVVVQVNSSDQRESFDLSDY